MFTVNEDQILNFPFSSITHRSTHTSLKLVQPIKVSLTLLFSHARNATQLCRSRLAQKTHGPKMPTQNRWFLALAYLLCSSLQGGCCCWHCTFLQCGVDGMPGMVEFQCHIILRLARASWLVRLRRVGFTRWLVF